MTALVALVFALAVAAPVAAQPDAGVIADVLVHGNHSTPDADILALADLAPGTPATEAVLEEARARVAGSGRFVNVEVRRRMASIADPTQVTVIVLVTERPGVSPDNLNPGFARRLHAATMWLPILAYEDGHGATFGARASLVEVFGGQTRISVPLTWGGDRRAAVEVERRFDSRFISRVVAVAGVGRRVNPFDEIADTRSVLGLRVEHAVRPWLRVSAIAQHEEIAFAGERGAASVLGMDVVIDTRIDPTFPRNGLRLAAAGERLGLRGTFDSTRWKLDAEGYAGLPFSSVLALRALVSRADQPLPRHERVLLGGAGTLLRHERVLLGGTGMLRGLPAGHASGDSVAAVSAELRVPLTSPLSIRRVGVKAFIDTGATWNVRESLADQPLVRGVGGGVFFGVAALQATLDVGRSGGQTRWHAGLGLRF